MKPHECFSARMTPFHLKLRGAFFEPKARRIGLVFFFFLPPPSVSLFSQPWQPKPRNFPPGSRPAARRPLFSRAGCAKIGQAFPPLFPRESSRAAHGFPPLLDQAAQNVLFFFEKRSFVSRSSCRPSPLCSQTSMGEAFSFFLSLPRLVPSFSHTARIAFFFPGCRAAICESWPAKIVHSFLLLWSSYVGHFMRSRKLLPEPFFVLSFEKPSRNLSTQSCAVSSSQAVAYGLLFPFPSCFFFSFGNRSRGDFLLRTRALAFFSGRDSISFSSSLFFFTTFRKRRPISFFLC